MTKRTNTEGKRAVSPPGEVTDLLEAWSRGEAEAENVLLPIVYNELKRIARLQLRKEQSTPTFQPTDLVHEAYLRLAGQNRARWKNRQNFFAIASRMMRRVLVDRARSVHRLKRGGGRRAISLEDLSTVPWENPDDVLAIDEALSDLAQFDTRKARITELRFFGGLTVEEVAQTLDGSPRTIAREWRLARAWLSKRLGEDQPRP